MKALKSDAQFDYALTVLLDSWIAVTAQIEASASILEGAADLPALRDTIKRGDAAIIAALRRDRLEERLS